jgi:hypothetical protein
MQVARDNAQVRRQIVCRCGIRRNQRVGEGVNDLSANDMGNHAPDLAIESARCEVAPVGAEANLGEESDSEHTLFECGSAGEREESRGGSTTTHHVISPVAVSYICAEPMVPVAR